MLLSARRRATLEALCRRIVPAAYPGGLSKEVDLASHVEARLANGDPRIARQLAILLTLFDSPVTGLWFGGSPHRFTRRTQGSQDAWLRAWETSVLPPLRTIFQAFRRLIISTYYALPSSWDDIGYLGAFHLREGVYQWEGALPGTPSDSEPVGRIAMSATNSETWTGANGVPTGVVQGRDLPAELRARADVCVIGTGAGGAVAAARLAEAGYEVILLEEGGYWTAADFTEDEGRMTPRLYADSASRSTDDLSVVMLQGRCVGGGTTVNWMVMLRTPEWVLDEWADEHGCEGMSVSEMAAIFELVEQETHTRTVPADAHSPNNRILLDGARTLGWKARAAKINARDCVRAGFCGIGCRYGAKQSALVTYIPRALAAGTRLYSDVRADHIEIVGRATGSSAPLKRVHGTVLDRDTALPRGRIEVEAPVVVLAAGAVGTPSILQRSGLGGGGVGKYLRLHPTTAVLGFYDRDIYGAAGIPLSAVCDEFLRIGSGGYGSWIECAPMLPGLASVAVPGFGSEHRDVMLRYARLGALIVLARDGASRQGSDGDVRVDRGGRPHIRYRLSKPDRANLMQGVTAAAELHFAAGASETRTAHANPVRMRSPADVALVNQRSYGPNQLGLFSAHVNGTCRIGKNPATSGCGPTGERHGARGLYVADGSLLPTAPGVNPQETIMAVATVVAQRIVEQERRV